jgi:hypothetical protein
MQLGQGPGAAEGPEGSAAPFVLLAAPPSASDFPCSEAAASQGARALLWLGRPPCALPRGCSAGIAKAWQVLQPVLITTA